MLTWEVPDIVTGRAVQDAGAAPCGPASPAATPALQGIARRLLGIAPGRCAQELESAGVATVGLHRQSLVQLCIGDPFTGNPGDGWGAPGLKQGLGVGKCVTCYNVAGGLEATSGRAVKRNFRFYQKKGLIDCYNQLSYNLNISLIKTYKKNILNV